MIHAKTLPGNPYDGHTPRAVIEEAQALTDREIERVYANKAISATTPPIRSVCSCQARSAPSTDRSNVS